jgi:hypothetical protein
LLFADDKALTADTVVGLHGQQETLKSFCDDMSVKKNKDKIRLKSYVLNMAVAYHVMKKASYSILVKKL